uniref:ras association domain-containing protein 8-like n=1 Tax=Pristiophorus japonicus TaxID=55135 RepID=UPI00398F0A26
MELKVWVDGVQRVVCGVNERTTCQEVVIALAQAMGRTGRYTLKEKWKDVERLLTPDEKLLPSLSKWGQQAKDVQLILNRTGPSLNLRPASDKLRGPERSAHRQSLPPLAKLRNKSDKSSHLKEAKRKSLNFAEGAREWLESFGKSREAKAKVRGAEPEREAAGCDPHPAGELNRLLLLQQETLRCLQAELESTEVEIRRQEAEEELATAEVQSGASEELSRLQELCDQRGPEAQEVEFWENELKAERLHGDELRGQLEATRGRLGECEHKLRDCAEQVQALKAHTETARSHAERQAAKACQGLRAKVHTLTEDITVQSQEAVQLKDDVRLVEEAIERVESEIQRKRCEMEELTRELRQANLLQFIQQTGTKVSILPVQEGPAEARVGPPGKADGSSCTGGGEGRNVYLSTVAVNWPQAIWLLLKWFKVSRQLSTHQGLRKGSELCSLLVYSHSSFDSLAPCFKIDGRVKFCTSVCRQELVGSLSYQSLQLVIGVCYLSTPQRALVELSVEAAVPICSGRSEGLCSIQTSFSVKCFLPKLRISRTQWSPVLTEKGSTYNSFIFH